MFLVVNVDLQRHPKFISGEKKQDELLSELFQRCVAGSDRTEWKGVVVAPGYGFATEEPMKEKSDFVVSRRGSCGSDDQPRLNLRLVVPAHDVCLREQRRYDHGHSALWLCGGRLVHREGGASTYIRLRSLE
jgi:hypothetical protein